MRTARGKRGLRYVFAAFIALLLAAWFGRGALLKLIGNRIRQHPAYIGEMERYQRSQEAEDAVVEVADWFGTTGLDEELERELPKYLRREFGESLLEEGSLKAADLGYVGAFEEDGHTVHYWRVPTSSAEPAWAYIEIDAGGGSLTGWGDRAPPTELARPGDASRRTRQSHTAEQATPLQHPNANP